MLGSKMGEGHLLDNDLEMREDKDVNMLRGGVYPERSRRAPRNDITWYGIFSPSKGIAMENATIHTLPVIASRRRSNLQAATRKSFYGET